MKTYTLLDMRGLMLTSHHSSPYQSLVTEAGQKVTSWQDGLAKVIEDVLKPAMEADIPPQSIIAVWDGGNDHRIKMFPEYKLARKKRAEEQRKSCPEASEQIKLHQEKLTELLANLGIKSVVVPGEEADDVVALLCERLEADHIIVRTVDKDLTMLVSDRVSVWVRHEFFEANNTSPEYIHTHKALLGDGDGYKGVKKLGKVSFAELEQAYGRDGVVEIGRAIRDNNFAPVQAAYDSTKDSNLKKILEHWSGATLSWALAKLAPEACYGNYRALRPKRPVWTARVPNRDVVLGLLQEIRQEQDIALFEHLFPREILAAPSDHEQLLALGEEIVASPVVAWDYESSDKLKHPAFGQAKRNGKYVDVLSQQIAGISVNFGRYMEKTVYLPVDHADTPNFPIEWLAWLLAVIESRPQNSVVQNANFELTLNVTNQSIPPGQEPKAPYDTAIMASYVDENEQNHLKGMSKRFLGYEQDTYEEVTKGRDMYQLTGKEVLSYGCDDSLVTSHLFVLFRLIMELEGSWEFYTRYEVEPAVNDVLDFIDGQDVDYEELERQSLESRKTIEEASDRVRAQLAKHVNTIDEQELTRRALVLFNEWYAVDKFKVEEGKDTDEEIRQKLWSKAWRLCLYEPYNEQVEVPEFSSTPTNINRVITAIDPDAPHLGRASGPGVDELEEKMLRHIERPMPIGTDRPQDEKLQEFLSLLFPCRKRLGPAGRSGAPYVKFCEFAASVLSGAGAEKVKIIKTGDELNVNSTPQMQGLLYGKLGLPIRKRSKVTRGSLRDAEGLKGAPASGLKAIEAAFVYDLGEAAEDDWRRQVLLDYRTVALETQNNSLYYRPYPLWKHPRDGKIHPQLRNCGTKTRRPAGNDPNELQVSKKEGGKIRRIYTSGDYGDGPRVTVCADFANQELVFTACESKDQVMLDAFMQTPRRDLHSLTSCSYCNILLDRIMPVEERASDLVLPGDWEYDAFMAARHGDSGPELAKATNQIRNKFSKAVNFLIAYLGGYTTLAGNLLISDELAKQLMDNTFKLYARLAPWQQETIEFARVHGYTQTAFGNRRHATSDLYSSDDGLRTRMERQVVNAVIQGGAADLLKLVRQEIVRRRMRQNYRMRAIAPVYDEIKASVPLEAALEYCLELVETMEITPPGYEVGMKVELSIGQTWGDQVELDDNRPETIRQALENLQQSVGEAA